MAQLKDTTVSSNLRVSDATLSGTVQLTTLRAPTTAGGTTYGPGTTGQFIRSNGTSSYWGSLAAADIPALNYVPNTQTGMNTALNLLSTGSSTPTDNDWYISQYAGGGTTTTTFHRRPVSALWSYMAGKIGSAGGAIQPVYVSSGVPTACTLPASGAWFSSVPNISSAGAINIGRYIDFHATNTSTNDYDVRFDASSTSLVTLVGNSGNAIICISGTAPTIRLKQTTSGKEFDSASIWTRPANTNGSQLFMQSGGITMIGAGEFCTNALARKDANNETVVGFDNIVTTNVGAEKMYIGSDDDVKIITNGQNIGTYNNNDHKVWQFETTGELLTPGIIKDSLSAQHTMIAQSVRSSGNSVILAKWIVDGAASTTYLPQISFYNMGGDETDKGAITLLPYHSNTDPWGGTIGLYIGKNILKLDNQSVLHTGNTSASTSTVSGATTIKSIKINNTNYNIYDSGNTDTQVTQSSSASTQYRPVILGYTNTTTIADLANTVTNQVYATTNLFVKPSAGELHIGHQLYGDGSSNSTRVEVPLIGHNGTNIWIGSTAQQAAHFLGKIHISTGYDSGNSIGNPTAWLDIPNADNTNSTASAILHASYILHTTTSTANTWENLGCGVSTVSTNLHVTLGGSSSDKTPSCWAGQDCSGLIYGRGSTRGYISQVYNTPKVTLGGGRIDSSHTGPEWYFSITGTTETSYNLDNIPKVTQNVLATSVTDTYPLLISNYKTSDSTTTTAAVANRIMKIYAKPSEGALYATKLALTDNCTITAGSGTTPCLRVKRSDLDVAVDVRVSGDSSANSAGLYSVKIGGYLVCATQTGYTYLRTNLYRPSSQASNLSLPIFGSSAGTGTKMILHSDGYVITVLNGSTTTTGKANLRLGNPTGQGTANNMEGKLIIYGKKTGWGMMTVDPDVTSNEWIFPKRSGKVAVVDIPVQLYNNAPPSSALDPWSITNSAFDWSDFKYIILRAYRYDGTSPSVPQEQESSLISYAWLLNQESGFQLRPGVLKIFNSTAFAYSFSSTGFQATIKEGSWDDTGWLLEVWGVM